MSRYKFYTVTIDGVEYKVQGHDEEDAREQALDIDIGGRAERKYIRDTIDEDTEISVERD